MAPESTLAAHIRSLEERLLQSDVRKSPHELDRVLADDFIEFASDGRPYDKRQVIEALQHEDVFRRSLTDFRLRLLADDVALATFCAIREDTRSAEIVRSLRSSIWRRGRNEWQVVFHQGTLVQEYLSDDEYSQLQQALIADPEAGSIIPGSGGVRKFRWGLAGRGKRGGLRVIYYLRTRQGQIWMLTLYPKNVAENIPVQVLRQIKDEVDG